MIDIRYMAGLFDGEGCICLVKQRRVDSDLPVYSIRCVLAMCHKPFIKSVQAQFGGLYTERKGAGKSRNSFALQWTNNRAKPFLEALLPHLVMKLEEAEIALDFLARLRHPGTSFWRRASKIEIECLQAEREFVRAKLSALKRVNHSVRWDGDEFGEQPMPGSEKSAEGQPRAKQTGLKLVGRV